MLVWNIFIVSLLLLPLIIHKQPNSKELIRAHIHQQKYIWTEKAQKRQHITCEQARIIYTKIIGGKNVIGACTNKPIYDY